MIIEDRIKGCRAAGDVTRFHTFRTLVPETVAQHTFNVMNLILLMTDGAAPAHVLVAALTHDMGEYEVGDIPGPVKRGFSHETTDLVERLEEHAISELHPRRFVDISPAWQRVIKLADLLDGLLKCREEILLGNRRIREVGDRYVAYIFELTDTWTDYRVFAAHCIQLYRGAIEDGR